MKTAKWVGIILALAVLVFVLGALVYNYSAVICQTGQPWSPVKDVIRLAFKKSGSVSPDSVKLSNSDSQYLNKNQGDGEAIDNSLWSTATNDQGLSFQYPKELSAKYLSAVEWPPVIRVEAGTYSCEATPQEASHLSKIISPRLVDNQAYCLSVEHEGAAGSVYSSYIYTIVKNDQLVKVSFTLRYPNCDNYEEGPSQVCASEREAFDIDSIVNRIVQTIQ